MRVFLALAGLASLMADQSAFAQGGSLDPTFGFGGMLSTWLHHKTYKVQWVGIQADGKILAAGFGGPDFFTAARYNENGSLDTTFDVDGIAPVSVTEAGSALANDGVLQPDGKLIMAGYVSDAVNAFALLRLNTDGSVDSTFGVNGIVVTDIGWFYDIAYAMALQPDGKIVVAGKCEQQNGDRIAVVRYLASGDIDTTFGNGSPGIFLLDPWQNLGHVACDVVIQEDGKILVAGTRPTQTNEILVLRLTPEGILDDGYGTNGVVTTNFSGSAEATALALQDDGKAVVAGRHDHLGVYGFAAARYTTEGVLDPTFGTNGLVTMGFVASSDASAQDLAVLSDGRIALTGYASYGHDLFAMVCLDASGAMDITFGMDGFLLTDVGPEGSRALAMAADPEGRLVVGGYTNHYVDFAWYSKFTLMRHLMGPTSIEGYGLEHDGFMVFPDPAEGFVRIRGAEGGDRIAVRSIGGQVLLTRDVHQEGIDLSSLPAGCYLIEIERAGRIVGQARFVMN